MILQDSPKKFNPPPEGVHHGIAIDVADLGNVDTKWGKKHKIRIVWELDTKDEQGKAYLASKKYTASLNEKAVLRADLKAWRGRDFTAAELSGFDMDKIVGAIAQILITHDVMPDGKVFANVKALMKAKPGVKITPTVKYTRFKDRAENQEHPTEIVQEAPEIDNENPIF